MAEVHQAKYLDFRSLLTRESSRIATVSSAWQPLRSTNKISAVEAEFTYSNAAIMPPSQQVSRDHPLPTSVDQRREFKFPANSHLLITTPGHIYSWDATSLHTIFASGHNGILAAREAGDGSGVLAIADKHNVVLHDTKRGQERSCGLQADNDGVRHLEYTSDAKSIFLSTELTTDIQRYSTERSRLLSPTKAHATSPTALAVSPTGHLMVSASENPTAVYLSNLAHNSAPLLIEPRASEAAVTYIAFHSERPDIFFLGFADGVAAVFDATKIGRTPTTNFTNQESISRGELGRLTGLHRPVLESKRTCCFEGAAFLPGHRCRVITAGRDGRCRLVEFADKGTIIRTWHAHAPITSLSVVLTSGRSIKPTIGSSRPDVRKCKAREGDFVIAIGRIDGTVQLYDALGLLLEQKALRSSEKIINVEWMTGKSPRAITNSVVARGGEVLPTMKANRPKDPESKMIDSAGAYEEPTVKKRRSTSFEHVGLLPALRRPKGTKLDSTPTTGAVRQLTVHPDEINEGTVRQYPLPDDDRQPHVANRQYLDLFSPVKPHKNDTVNQPVKLVASPPRTRPKVSEQTFVREAPHEGGYIETAMKPQSASHFSSEDSRVWNGPQSKHDCDRTVCQVTPKVRRFAANKPRSLRSGRVHESIRGGSGPFNDSNAKILADLRRLDPTQSSHQTKGVLAGIQNDPSRSRPMKMKHSYWHPRQDEVENDWDSHRAFQAYDDSQKQDWLEDSHQGSSLEDDIWLTSDAETKKNVMRRSRRRPVTQRPPARQTSRSRVDSGGTLSTIAQYAEAKPSNPSQPTAVVDGSTEEEMFTADETCIGADGILSPSSRDVQQLFPRTSSLSPRKHHLRRKSARRTSSIQRARVLREITANALPPKQLRTPWSKAKAIKEAISETNKLAKPSALQTGNRALVSPPADNEPISAKCCSGCSETQSRMHNVESEVARLQGEVLILKAVLRRQGLPMPPSLRRT